MANWRNVLLLAAVPALVCAANAEAATLNKWTFNNSTKRLEFTTDSSVQPKAFLIFNPYRIVIDLPNTKLTSASVKQAYSGDVKQVRLGQFDATTTRIVIELDPRYVIDAKQTIVKRTTGNTWVLDLSGTVGLPATGTTSVPLKVSDAGSQPLPTPPSTTPKPPTTDPNPPTTAPKPPTSANNNSPSARNFCRAQVPSALNSILNRSSSTQWGVLVQTQSGTTLFDRNASTLLAPASNNKVFTTAAALAKLGPDYRIKTQVLGDGQGATINNLRIVGQGDPSLTGTGLRSLTQQLKTKGVRNVDFLIGDDTLFKGPSINPNWLEEDLGQAYAPPINSLSINQNIIGLTLSPRSQGQPLAVAWDDPSDQQDWVIDNRTVTSSPSGGEFVDVVPSGNRLVITGALRQGSEPELVGVAIANEGNYLVSKFAGLLRSSQVPVARTTVVTRTPAPKGLVELAAIESDPVAKLIAVTNLESNNFYAETLLKILGANRLANAADTRLSGINEVKSILVGLGVDGSQVQMVDGSGLAPNNRASAKAFVQTLNAMANGKHAAIYKSSMPVGGRSGTLSNRFRGTAAQGRVFAKTGTISGVVSLSGYVDPVNHPQISFSILANTGSSASAIRAIVDEAVIKLVDLDDC